MTSVEKERMSESVSKETPTMITMSNGSVAKILRPVYRVPSAHLVLVTISKGHHKVGDILVV